MIRPRHDNLLLTLLLIGAGVMLFVLAWPLFANEIFLEHDVGAVFVPLRWFYAQCLASGESFLWLPNIYMGVYLQGEGQTGMTHPLHWALYKFLPFTSAFDLELLLSYPALFAGTVLWLRRWRLPNAAVLFGALLFTFSGYPITSWLWLVHVEVLVHTPWLLWCIDIAMRDRSPRKVTGALFGVTMLTASAILAGYPQMVYVSGLAEGMYALFLWRRGSAGASPSPVREQGANTAPWIMLLLLFVAKVLGAACAAIQILPTLDLLEQSTRTSTTAAFRLQQSLHPMDLLNLVNPYLYHQRMFLENGYQQVYGGLTATLLVAWTVLHWRRLGELRPLAVCGLALAAVGLVLTLGKYGLAYRWVSMLPIVDSFRGPARHGALFHVGWTLTAVVALTHLLHTRREGNDAAWRELRVLALLPVLSAALAILIAVIRLLPEVPSWLHDIEREFAPTWNPVFGAALMAVAFACFVLAARGHRSGMLVLILFTIFDLSWYGLRHRTAGDFEEFRASIDVPEAPPEYRIDPDWRHVYNVNGPLMKGYSSAAGLVSIEPARTLDYNVNLRNLQLAGAKWLRVRYGTNDELNLLYEQGIEWLELPNPMPRARLVSEVIVSNDPARDVEGLDYARIALVDAPIDLEGPVGEARVLEDRPGVIAVSTNSSGRNLLVLTEAYARGWRAEIDGAAAPIARAYGDFQACVVPAGEHTARFTFDPASWRWGKRLTAIGIAFAVVWHVIVFRILSSRSPEAPPNIRPRSLAP